jgi:hypothetical protein
MRGTVLSGAAILFACAQLFAAEVQVKPSTPAAPQSPAPTAARAPSASPAAVEPVKYLPALLGTGPNSVINRMDTQELMKRGQKDASILFCCSVEKTGRIMHSWTYRGSPGSALLEQELVRRLDQSVFIPAIHNHQPVHVLFYGTVTFAIANGKPRLRIFANQETEEVKKESDFIGPQPFVGRDSKFEGLHYPNEVVKTEMSGVVELGLKVDAEGKLKELRVVSENPPLLGFGLAAASDFRVASFVPAFREGKPVECSITLPVYYEP